MGLTLAYTEDSIAPIHDGISSSPELDREIVLGGQGVDGVETITSFVYGEPEAYESLLDGVDRVREYDVTPSDDGFFLYLRRELGPDGASLLNALARETVVIVPPIVLRSDRTIRLTVVGHPADLQEILGKLSDDDGTTVDVRWVSDDVTLDETPVTDRQLDALRVAWEAGYYELPRENGIETVADELGCAVSTASELLRRGEAAAIGKLLDGGP